MTDAASIDEIRERITILKRMRGSIKRQLTNFEKTLNSITVETDISNLDLETRLHERHLPLQKEFETCQEELEALTGGNETEEATNENERESFDERFYLICGRVKTLIKRGRYIPATIANQSVVQPPITSENGELESAHSSGGSATMPINVSLSSDQSTNSNVLNTNNGPFRRTPRGNLPDLKIPTFSGSLDAWLSFFDSFNSMIHNDPDIPVIEKFHYLKGCVTGDASNIISSLQTTCENYNVAWELLKNRYHNKKFIIDSHVKALFELQMVSKDYSIRVFYDSIQKHLRALRALSVEVDKWNAMLIHLIKSKLNNYTVDKWEESVCDKDYPTLDDILKFLQRRSQIEETKAAVNQANNTQKFPNAKGANSARGQTRNQQPYAGVTTTVDSTSHNFQSKPPQGKNCHICKGDHGVYSCTKFLGMSIKEKYEVLRKASVCTNCLRGAHQPRDCLAGGCRKCGKRHNTLLHVSTRNPDSFSPSDKGENSQQNLNGQSSPSNPQKGNPVNSCNLLTPSEVVLATAIVDIIDAEGKLHSCRAMLDSGSQPHVITERFINKIGLKKTAVNVPLHAVGDLSTNIKYMTSATIKSRYNDATHDLTLYVVSHIGTTMPTLPINRNSFSIPEHLFLADPSFYSPSEVDMIIGAQYFYQLLSSRQIPISNHPAVLQETELGWVVSGHFRQTSERQKKMFCNFTQFSDLSILWELDSTKEASKRSREEEACELHYKNTTKRDTSGRYIVQLPFNENKAKLGESYKTAFRRFNSLESKLAKEPLLKAEYIECMQTYINEGHMTLLQNKKDLDTGVFLSHHAVIKTTSLTTKTRVVFDASCKTSSGLSLNDTLMVGPTIQDDLFTTFTRFRTCRFALTADIEQMYRQIPLHSEHRLFHKILWQTNPNEPINTYTLNTVTFGTASAPYLAIRTLHQLADDECANYPKAAEVLRSDFYVDDLLTGANTVEEAIELRDNLIQILQKGGFNLRKWNSNESSLIQQVDSKSNSSYMYLDPSETIKTLGLYWNPRKDSIMYTVFVAIPLSKITKRQIFSQTAKLFDPLGLLGPIIVIAKLLIQKLWKEKLTWDQEIPSALQKEWNEYETQLIQLSEISFPRYINVPNHIDLQIHGFCDASEKAYGACLYLRSTDQNGKHHAHLICSKSRVAPMKQISLPKLELCAAVLLANLFTTTYKSLKLKINKFIFWSDSTITLHWINSESHSLNTFVANRAAEIQTLTDPKSWRHVPTSDNPADAISRGQLPRDFQKNELWLHGPQWLCQNENNWPSMEFYQGEDPEKRKTTKVVSLKLTVSNWDLLEKYSSLRTLQHVLAYCLRFIHNLRHKNKIIGPLSSSEINSSQATIIKLTQSTVFAKDIQCLAQGKTIDTNSKLLSLNPFLENGLLKVGGRLENAVIPDNQKHPLLLPRDHHITRLIIREEHIRRMHAGAQATLYGVRETYWPMDGRNLTRNVIRQCITCFKVKPRGVNYIMGNLPKNRVTPNRPFLNVGIDYCGPFFIKEKRHRNRNKVKAYVAVYVCFTTKAIHLEVASDLTTDAFIGSLKRFISRRGKPIVISSDNAKNFIGAKNELKELYHEIEKVQKSSQVQNYLSERKISWHFIPPRAPHFGGLWEASVKSFKHHLIRTVGDNLLTYDQLETCIVEIEAILNSRPLTPLSSDPNDLLPLTPGHFLIGSSLTSFPQTDLRDIPAGRLSSWQLAQQMRSHFWARWQKEYLQQLTSRSKWQTATNLSNITIGTMVVIQEDNLPPMHWKLGRVIEVYPGTDDVVRVVSVRTSTGVYKRAVKKLFPLPLTFSEKEL